MGTGKGCISPSACMILQDVSSYAAPLAKNPQNLNGLNSRNYVSQPMA